jgi:probable rRNA maturation factor
MPVIHFFENGRPVPVRSRTPLKGFLIDLFRKEKKALEALNYIFCDDETLYSINKDFLQHSTYTDIITFPLSDPGDPVTADIYISVDRVRENSKVLQTPFQREIHRVIFHGALHLCGYKDKSPKEQATMRRMEEKYLLAYLGEE